MTRSRKKRDAESRRPEASTAGFTLIELLLVLGLIGLAAAWAAPQWQAQLARQRLESAATDLRSLWKETRLKAIEEAASYQFDVVPGTAYYRVRAFPMARQSVHGDRGRFDDDNDDLVTTKPPGQLSDGVRIVVDRLENGGEAPPSTGREGRERADAAPSEGEWVPWIVFDPRGTATDARLTLESPAIRARRQLTLRGLTGGVKIDTVPYPEPDRE